MHDDRDRSSARRPLALVFDPNPDSRANLLKGLVHCGIECIESNDAQEVVRALQNQTVALVAASVGKGGPSLTDDLRTALLDRGALAFVALAHSGDGDHAARWIHAGVDDWLERPLADWQVEGLAARAHRAAQSWESVTALVGSSPAVRQTRDELTLLAATDKAVWLYGEPGAETVEVCRLLHERSNRSRRRFTVVPAPGIGGWNDALHHASNGTLCISGLADLTAEAQARLADDLPHNCAARIVSAGSLARFAEVGGQLDALGAKLGAGAVTLPRLGDRAEDIPAIVRSLVANVCAVNRLPVVSLTQEAIGALVTYGWPGGIHELRNAIEGAVLVVNDGSLRGAQLPEAIRGRATQHEAVQAGMSARPFREAKKALVERFEAAYLAGLLDRHDGNVTLAAKHSGMLRSALQRLLRKYQIKSADYRGDRPGRRPRKDRAETPMDRSADS